MLILNACPKRKEKTMRRENAKRKTHSSFLLTKTPRALYIDILVCVFDLLRTTIPLHEQYVGLAEYL